MIYVWPRERAVDRVVNDLLFHLQRAYDEALRFVR